MAYRLAALAVSMPRAAADGNITIEAALDGESDRDLQRAVGGLNLNLIKQHRIDPCIPQCLSTTSTGSVAARLGSVTTMIRRAPKRPTSYPISRVAPGPYLMLEVSIVKADSLGIGETLPMSELAADAGNIGACIGDRAVNPSSRQSAFPLRYRWEHSLYELVEAQ